MDWKFYLARGPFASVHDICGNQLPKAMKSKPPECLAVELSLRYRPGDTCIVTFPKTGTTMIQYICHLIRTQSKGVDFDDIHQVCPHTSSAWFVGQDLNESQVAVPRLFKSHRELSQVAPYTSGIDVKYISTIRDPLSTLLSLFSFEKERKSQSDELSLLQYAQSAKWSEEYSSGAITSIFDCYVTFWQCRCCFDFLLLPYEDVVNEREKWITIVSKFMGVLCSPEVILKIAKLTSKENMLLQVSKFDESWCKRQRELLNRPHPIIKETAAKVTAGHDDLLANSGSTASDVRSRLVEINDALWKKRVTPATGFDSYQDMREALYKIYFAIEVNQH